MVPGRQATDEMIAISGLVNDPGMFTVKDADRVEDFIAYAGGSKGDLADMIVVITPGNGSPPSRLDGADPSTFDEIPTPGSNITLIWKNGKKALGTVIVFGEVVRPGIYPVESDSFSLSDLLTQCGGITSDGYLEMIQIHRLAWRDHFDGVRKSRGNPEPPNGGKSSAGSSGNGRPSGLISYNPRHPLDHSLLALVDGDSIYVPRATGMVAVTGAVASPGLIKFQRGKGVEYYLQQAGGLGYGADREKTVVINPVTGGRIGAGKAGELFDGETLYVPRKENGNGS
jgi:protein involved in polysaccharide export with SLBB domain